MLQKHITEQDTLLLSIGETAERLGLRPVTIRAWAIKRKIARVRLGRRTLIPQSEITRLIEENLIPALPEVTSDERRQPFAPRRLGLC